MSNNHHYVMYWDTMYTHHGNTHTLFIVYITHVQQQTICCYILVFTGYRDIPPGRYPEPPKYRLLAIHKCVLWQDHQPIYATP